VSGCGYGHSKFQPPKAAVQKFKNTATANQFASTASLCVAAPRRRRLAERERTAPQAKPLAKPPSTTNKTLALQTNLEELM